MCTELEREKSIKVREPSKCSPEMHITSHPILSDFVIETVVCVKIINI